MHLNIRKFGYWRVDVDEELHYALDFCLWPGCADDDEDDDDDRDNHDIAKTMTVMIATPTLLWLCWWRWWW